MMEYGVKALSNLAGVSVRTLHYYDRIGLLKPLRISGAGYRVYGGEQVDALQQILFFRELGFSLEEIRQAVTAPDFDRLRALKSHLGALKNRRTQLSRLIINVTKTIDAMKGAGSMKDKDKFEGLKRGLIEKNEAKYGREAREKYGDSAVDASNEKVMGMTGEQYERSQTLSEQIADALKAAMRAGDPAGKDAQHACDLHRQWLCLFWPDGMYSKERHMGLAAMYCEDERFKAHYEAIAPGCAEFLRDAMAVYTAVAP